MAGVPSFVFDGPWWGLFVFLCGVVFFRTQGTYWIARWARTGADAVADRAEAHHSRRARLARRFSGPGMERARAFLERWGYLGIPVSFLTVGFQTMVNATAGYTRMRWDLYTLAMIPGCLAWATVYTAIGLSLWEAWLRSPWLLAAAVVAIVGAAFGLNRWRRRRRPSQPADASSPYAS
ncbi:DedA family protein [Demequina rhizosphaerae]|uniref:DedA family protein n=1 Tax=Demequina rhizosphaerae TaxID=1638985 RepID=UPI000AF5D77B|nr:VTT domain-containing protein [Demequina rhizosphaerae]